MRLFLIKKIKHVNIAAIWWLEVASHQWQAVKINNIDVKFQSHIYLNYFDGWFFRIFWFTECFFY